MARHISRRNKDEALLDLRAVADRAQVSIATVSRTINQVPTVNAKLAQRVWAVINEFGYVPNTQARALVSGRSGVLGLVVSEITNPFFPELIQGFEEVAITSGYEILISSTNYDPKRMELCIRRLLQRKAEGVAVLTFGIEQPLFEQFFERKIPLVFVDVGPDRPGVSVLKIDYAQGIRQGVQHLAALGHRKISFISGPVHLHSAQARLQAFVSALSECGIKPNQGWLLTGDHTLAGGTRCMETLLAMKQRPTAIMCSNDMTAIGVMHEADRAGLHIPDDFSVVGFDDIQIAEVMIPSLTSVRLSRTALASAAVEALKAQIEGKHPLREYQIDTHLVVRRSTSFPSGSMEDLVVPQGKKDRRAGLGRPL